MNVYGGKLGMDGDGLIWMDGDENLRGGWRLRLTRKQRERKIDSNQTNTETQSWIYNNCQLAFELNKWLEINGWI